MINGIEVSTEIKQYRDRNVLPVQNIVRSLLLKVLFQCCDFFYKQTAQLGRSNY